MKRLIIGICFLSACSSVDHKENNSVDTLTTAARTNIDTIIYKPAEKLSVTGDFDGDGKVDTLVQDNISRVGNKPIDLYPDPFNNEWDTVVSFFYKEGSDVIVTMLRHEHDTLSLGTGMGLYCLVNIGDSNGDGRDEIALVKDNLDISRVNSCHIYSLCNHSWQELFSFGIHEDAFNFSGDTIPVFSEIKDFLEKRNKDWFYHDYSEQGYDTPGEVGKMKLLKVKRCSK